MTAKPAVPPDLLQTKLFRPPPPPGLLPRPRLLTQLDEAAAAGQITLVAAPAGYGKTSLVAAWAAQRGAAPPTAWLSLEEADADPARFWRYAGAALQQAKPALGAGLSQMLNQPATPPVHSILPPLLNELAAAGPLTLVLDDLHRLDNPLLYEGLSFLADHAPPTFQLLLLSRTDPPLPLHRWRAAGRLRELRAAALRFRAEEADAYLNQRLGLRLTPDEVAQVQQQTEGWPVGLHLAALALRDNPDRGTLLADLASGNRYVVDYLTAEVVDRQPPPLRRFLLQTSLLDRFNGELCAAVTGAADAPQLLAQLVEANLFLVPLDATGRWWRYHHLFADLLQARLQLESPRLIPLLHQRAARHLAAQQRPAAAVRHALAAAELPLAARLMDDHAVGLVMAGHTGTVAGWLEQLPADWRRRSPRTLLAWGWALLLRGDYGQLRELAAQIAAAIPDDDNALQGEWAAQQAVVAETEGRGTDALRLARRALASAPADNLLVAALAQFALAGALRQQQALDEAVAAYEVAIPRCQAARLRVPELLGQAHLAALLREQGEWTRGLAVCQPLLTDPQPHPLSAAALGAAGLILLERLALDEATRALENALHLAEESDHRAARLNARLALARLALAREQAGEARPHLQTARRLLAEGVPAWLALDATLQTVALALGLRDEPGAARALAAARTLVAAAPPPRLTLAAARLALYRGDAAAVDAARRDLAALLPLLDRRPRDAFETRLLLALLLDAEDSRPAALHILHPALAVAAAEQVILPFVELGRPMARLLAESDAPVAGRLLDAFPAQITADLTAAARLVEPLSRREQEILQLMARGLTYRQIGAELTISVNTVRHHVKGLYGKLQVNSRARAVEKGGRLGLLPD